VNDTSTLRRLRRIRWAVRATLTLGVAASVAANILHAEPNPISQSIAAWPPLALLLTVELVSRVPVHKRGLLAVRVLATTVIAGIAAWVSYWHMQGVATRYGETGTSPYLLPVSVDGLIVVASICLVELSARLRQLEEPTTTVPARPTVAAPTPPPAPGPVAAMPAIPAPARPVAAVAVANEDQAVTTAPVPPTRSAPPTPAPVPATGNGARRGRTIPTIGELRR
jgi:hypothetical protein